MNIIFSEIDSTITVYNEHENNTLLSQTVTDCLLFEILTELQKLSVKQEEIVEAISSL